MESGGGSQLFLVARSVQVDGDALHADKNSLSEKLLPPPSMLPHSFECMASIHNDYWVLHRPCPFSVRLIVFLFAAGRLYPSSPGTCPRSPLPSLLARWPWFCNLSRTRCTAFPPVKSGGSPTCSLRLVAPSGTPKMKRYPDCPSSLVSFSKSVFSEDNQSKVQAESVECNPSCSMDCESTTLGATCC